MKYKIFYSTFEIILIKRSNRFYTHTFADSERFIRMFCLTITIGAFVWKLKTWNQSNFGVQSTDIPEREYIFCALKSLILQKHESSHFQLTNKISKFFSKHGIMLFYWSLQWEWHHLVNILKIPLNSNNEGFLIFKLELYDFIERVNNIKLVLQINLSI